MAEDKKPIRQNAWKRANEYGLMLTADAGLIGIVPAVSRLELDNFPCWNHLRMRFSSRQNIIVGEDLSVEEIVRAVLAGLAPNAISSPTLSRPTGRSRIQMASRERRSLIGTASIPPPLLLGCESSGQRIMALLRSLQGASLSGLATFLREDVLYYLDPENRAEAVRILNALRCQIIYPVSRALVRRGALTWFPKARIFVCYRDIDNISARMTVRRRRR